MLFDAADIELRSSGPGNVREHGYRTTVQQALRALEHAGVTLELARECAASMQPRLATAYARGPGVRHVAKFLGPLEVFAADTFEAGRQLYQGTFLDLATLAGDVAIPGASPAFQALFLRTLLQRHSEGAPVFLNTEEWAKHRKPGERSFRRPSLEWTRSLRTALLDIAGGGATSTGAVHPSARGSLPHADVVAFVRARIDSATDEDARALFMSIERGLPVRDKPERGPLANPDLWAVEARFDAGDVGGIDTMIDALEVRHGRTPGTTYLRARAALARHSEPPKQLAERVSALALSMTSFDELSLLAAEAWLDAGDARRAMPYARNLVESANIDDGLRGRANAVLDAIGRAPTTNAPPRERSSAGPAPAPSAMPRSEAPTRPELRRLPSTIPDFPRPQQASVPPPQDARKSKRPSERPARNAPPPLNLDLPPPSIPSTSFTLELPRPPSIPPADSPDVLPTQSDAPRPPPSSTRPSRRIGLGIVTLETRPPPSNDGRVERDATEAPIPPADAQEALISPAFSMHGASLPPYRIEPTPPLRLTRATIPPRNDESDERIEHLLIPGPLFDHGNVNDGVPKSALQARIAFTQLARDLGAEYRSVRGLELRADVTGIEAMQAVLLESFPTRTVVTQEGAVALRRHGAALSEILARRLNAEWYDISPNSLGYWAMIVPPDTRVWPFGRIARLVERGHKERDLVSFYLELEQRARGR
jgi:hypothetical protein